jgi:transposase-like protein
LLEILSVFYGKSIAMSGYFADSFKHSSRLVDKVSDTGCQS